MECFVSTLLISLYLHGVPSKELRQLRVVRVKLNNGQRVIGLRYYEPLVAMVTKTLAKKFENDVSV